MSSASFSNPYTASPTSQLILQPFCCFTYGTAHSIALLLLDLHHLASRPCPYDDDYYIHDDFVICNDCGPQDYMKDVNWPSNLKGWRPLLYVVKQRILKRRSSNRPTIHTTVATSFSFSWHRAWGVSQMYLALDPDKADHNSNMSRICTRSLFNATHNMKILWS